MNSPAPSCDVQNKHCRCLWRDVTIFIGASIVALLAAHAADHYIWLQWVKDQRIMTNALMQDNWRLLRSFGYVPTWLLVAGAWLLIAWPQVRTQGWRVAWRTPLMLLLAVGVNAGVVEALKILIRRLRPEDSPVGGYAFRSWSERTWDGGGLGMPSSHAMIAFAAAFMLWRLHPRAWPVWLVVGVGCALSRVATGAHFVSDVTLAGIAAYGVVWMLHARCPAPRPHDYP